MFFTPDILTRRDSGFGLIWLAATLGSKSAFKKLPRRSVMTADIAQLCDLIAEPAEPMALRLSSNLMFGVVRVYKVKQEIFITDVNSCVTALKKMVQDMRQHAVADSALLLAQPIARPHVVTMQHDPETGHALMFDALFSVSQHSHSWSNNDDEDFNPKSRVKKKAKGREAKESTVETARQDAHILNEHHEHLISGPLERSFEGAFGSGSGGIDLSSSQIDGRFAFEDNFFATSDGFDLAGGLGDELAKELGWEIERTQINTSNGTMAVGLFPEVPVNPEISMDFALGDPQVDVQLESVRAPVFSTPRSALQKSPEGVCVSIGLSVRVADQFKFIGKGNMPISTLQDRDYNRASSVASFARAFLTQELLDADEDRQPLRDITVETHQNGKQDKKRKRARLLLDARTELTDEELKVARAKYLESQKALREDIVRKKTEKFTSKIIDDLIWGVPQGINAESLRRYWQDNFKVQVQARTSNIEVHLDEAERPKKRARKEAAEMDNQEPAISNSPQHEAGPQKLDIDLGMDQDSPMHDEGNIFERRSSDEPGQGRQRSRASSVARGSQFGIEINLGDSFGSQKSMFPWDHAGASSSARGHMFSDQVEFAQADVRLRSNSLSRRGSPLSRESSLPRSGSMVAGIGTLSPAVRHEAQLLAGDPAIDCKYRTSLIVPIYDSLAIPPEVGGESQRSEVALVTLERNSFNFLE
ncbi:Meiotic recombination protein rec8 [Leucoagaricus sp. SymC.cos]|nr:Meiotic recombination protein rec8 [Leucoagaricus sp. SymC.cos]